MSDSLLDLQTMFKTLEPMGIELADPRHAFDEEDLPWSPFPRPSYAAATLDVEEDAFFYNECYLWYWLEDEGYGDLSFVRCGKGPDYWVPWLNEVLQDLELWTVGGNSGDLRILTWSLEKGIAPYQPFLLHIPYPSTYYDAYNYEWDMECEIEIVKKAPVTYSARRYQGIVFGLLNGTTEQFWDPPLRGT